MKKKKKKIYNNNKIISLDITSFSRPVDGIKVKIVKKTNI